MAPLRRSGTPDDVADACLGLVDARYATGQVLLVDGGMSLRRHHEPRLEHPCRSARGLLPLTSS
jgi:hypothetical protein